MVRIEKKTNSLNILGLNKDDKQIITQKQVDFVEYLKEIMSTPSSKDIRILHLLNKCIFSCPCLTLQKSLKCLLKEFNIESIKSEIYKFIQSKEFQENRDCKCGDDEIIYDLQKRYNNLKISESEKANLINEGMEDPYIQELLKRDEYILTIQNNLKSFNGDASDIKDVYKCIIYSNIYLCRSFNKKSIFSLIS